VLPKKTTCRLEVMDLTTSDLDSQHKFALLVLKHRTVTYITVLKLLGIRSQLLVVLTKGLSRSRLKFGQSVFLHCRELGAAPSINHTALIHHGSSKNIRCTASL